MPTILEVKNPNITLLRLVINNRDIFYNQDWYFDQEFANTPLPTGIWKLEEGIGADVLPYATLCAWAWVNYPGGTEHFFRDYVWATDNDDSGNRIYVGGLFKGKRRLFQIHRHLEDPDVKFIHSMRG